LDVERFLLAVDQSTFVFLFLTIALIAFLYSSVGHAGASGYIATMALFGLAPNVIRPTALVLNILVASLGAFQFWRAGHFKWQLFWPFALLAIPGAFLGGYLQMPMSILRVIIGIVLLFSAARLFVRRKDPDDVHAPPMPVALGLGGAIGFLSGLTGTGGGIFLTPLLLFAHWAKTKQASAVSALFILVNSISGLVGFVNAKQSIPSLAYSLALAALLGGAIGSYLGSRRFPVRAIAVLLATVLVIAGAKLILTR
jgi:uncharacterized membrane protein YfcA